MKKAEVIYAQGASQSWRDLTDTLNKLYFTQKKGIFFVLVLLFY